MGNFIETARAFQIGDALQPITGTTSFTTLVGHLVQDLLIVAGVLAVIYLVYAGILYITAGGDTEKAGSARTAIINAIIGIFVILIALLIINWVTNLAHGVTTF